MMPSVFSAYLSLSVLSPFTGTFFSSAGDHVKHESPNRLDRLIVHASEIYSFMFRYGRRRVSAGDCLTSCVTIKTFSYMELP